MLSIRDNLVVVVAVHIYTGLLKLYKQSGMGEETYLPDKVCLSGKVAVLLSLDISMYIYTSLVLRVIGTVLARGGMSWSLRPMIQCLSAGPGQKCIVGAGLDPQIGRAHV